MEASRRLTNWLRLACALVLSAGLSTAVAATATGSLDPTSTTPTVAQLGVGTAAIHSIAVRSSTVLRHAAGKHHQTPAMGSALAIGGGLLMGLAAFAVQRRRNDPFLGHHTFSDGARAPPAVSCI
jgi:hypothetical protein